MEVVLLVENPAALTGSEGTVKLPLPSEKTVRSAVLLPAIVISI